MRHDWASLAAWTSTPVGCREGISLTRNNQSRIVLLCSIQLVRELIVRPNAVDFCGWLVHLCRPRPAAIRGDVCASIIRLNHDLAVVRIDPNVVIISVWSSKRKKSLSTINRLEESLGSSIDDLRIRRIYSESC